MVARLFRVLKGSLLVVLLAVLVLGGIQLVGHQEGEGGHAKYSASYQQRGEYQGRQAVQFENRAVTYDDRGGYFNQREDARNHWTKREGEHGHWGMFVIIPFLIAGLLIGWALFKKSKVRRLNTYFANDEWTVTPYQQERKVDFLDEWEKQTKTKRSQEEAE